MVRKARIDLPGVLQHIVARGNDRCLIFRDDQDRLSFINRLGSIVKETETRCYAWCLLPECFHLLLETEETPISKVMRRLMTGYAVSFNQRYRRNGHLFQNRYKSTICEKGPYFLELVRCIHLKPLEAGVVKSLSELDGYPWAGHWVLMDHSSSSSADFADQPSRSAPFAPLRFDWQACGKVLLRFGDGKKKAREGYRDFMKEGMEKAGLKDLIRMAGNEGEPSDNRIIGSEDFVTRVLKEAGELKEPKTKKISLQNLCEKVRSCFNVGEEDLRSPLKKRSAVDAKAAFAYLAIREMGYSGKAVGDYLNMAGYSAIRRSEKGKSVLKHYGLNLSDLS